MQVESEVPAHEEPDFTGFYGMGGWFRSSEAFWRTEDSFDSYGFGNSRLFVDPAAGLVVASLRNQGGESTHAASVEMLTSLYDALLPETAGDFNGDGFINSADLRQWEVDYAINGDSDANNDGQSNGGDFLIWQRTYERTVLAPSIPVPEPSSLRFATLAAALGCLVHRLRSTSTNRICPNQLAPIHHDIG